MSFFSLCSTIILKMLSVLKIVLECSNYGFLNESNRAMTYVSSSIGNLCDSALSGWYRFSGEAGTQMADSCPKIHHCSTDSPGWLNGTHPTVAEGIVQRKVCFLQHLNGTDCCYFSKDISVRNCGAFYVYRLDPPRCYSRYCGNGLPQAPGQNAFIRFSTRLMYNKIAF